MQSLFPAIDVHTFVVQPCFFLFYIFETYCQNDTFAYVLRTLGLLGLSTHSIAIISVENYCLSMVFKHMFCVPRWCSTPRSCTQSGQTFTCHEYKYMDNQDQPSLSTLPPTSKVACNKQQENIAVQDSIHSSSVACVQENGAH